MNLIFGFHPVREALRERPEALRRVLVARSRRGERRDEVVELCRELGVTVELRNETDLERMAPGVHNGFVAELAAGRGAAATGPRPDPTLRVLVEDIQDPRNLGALLRVCEGAGVELVQIRDRGSAPLSPTVGKTSAGAIEHLPVERVTNSARTIEEAKRDGYWVYAVEAGGRPPWQLDLSGKVLFCFGGEEKGLRARTSELCDGKVGLPMRGRVESLNLATAAAAVLYEAVRQRTSEKAPGPPADDTRPDDLPGETGKR